MISLRDTDVSCGHYDFIERHRCKLWPLCFYWETQMLAVAIMISLRGTDVSCGHYDFIEKHRCKLWPLWLHWDTDVGCGHFDFIETQRWAVVILILLKHRCELFPLWFHWDTNVKKGNRAQAWGWGVSGVRWLLDHFIMKSVWFHLLRHRYELSPFWLHWDKYYRVAYSISVKSLYYPKCIIYNSIIFALYLGHIIFFPYMDTL